MRGPQATRSIPTMFRFPRWRQPGPAPTNADEGLRVSVPGRHARAPRPRKEIYGAIDRKSSHFIWLQTRRSFESNAGRCWIYVPDNTSSAWPISDVGWHDEGARSLSPSFPYGGVAPRRAAQKTRHLSFDVVKQRQDPSGRRLSGRSKFTASLWVLQPKLTRSRHMRIPATPQLTYGKAPLRGTHLRGYAALSRIGNLRTFAHLECVVGIARPGADCPYMRVSWLSLP